MDENVSGEKVKEDRGVIVLIMEAWCE